MILFVFVYWWVRVGDCLMKVGDNIFVLVVDSCFCIVSFLFCLVLSVDGFVVFGEFLMSLKFLVCC